MAVLEPLFKALNDAGVRYVVVGGLAVVLHGHARLTVDVDLVVDLDEGPAIRAIDALVGMGLRPRIPVNPRDFANRSVREAWIRDRGMQVFSMFDQSNPMRAVDLFVDHPVPFEELWSRSVEFELQETTVRVASIPDLIHLKRLAGRAQDQADIEQLEAILRAKKKREDD
jgi:predicted nucleotidyltransferase